MALKDGDIIRFDYTLWLPGEAKPLETSMESVAKEHGIHREGRRYKPITIAIGAHQIIPGLESYLKENGEVGKTLSVTIPAEKAYGARDASKIRDIPMAQFRAQKVTPEVGMQLNLGQERGVVTRVAGGRVRVDTNHNLAGKDLKYDVKVTEVLQDEKDKVVAVLENLFPPGTYKYELGEKEVTVEVPDQVKFDSQWQIAKFKVVSDLRLATGSKKAVKLVEVFPTFDDRGLVPGHEGHAHGAEGHGGHDHGEGEGHEGHPAEGAEAETPKQA